MIKHGGKRPNAGRPKGSGPYQEETKPLRIPVSLLPSVKKYVAAKGYAIPLYTSKVQAGFPSPADDYQEGTLNLEEHLIQNPASTFFVRVIGNSMINAGMYPNDLLIVDKSLTPVSGKVIVAILNGEFTVKRLVKKRNKTFLVAENPDYEPIDVTDNSEFQIWGVVTNVIHGL